MILPSVRFVAACLCVAGVVWLFVELLGGGVFAEDATRLAWVLGLGALLAYWIYSAILMPLWNGGALRRGLASDREITLDGTHPCSLPVPVLRRSEGLEVWAVNVAPMIGRNSVMCRLLHGASDEVAELEPEDACVVETVPPWIVRSRMVRSRSVVLDPTDAPAKRTLQVGLPDGARAPVTVRLLYVPTVMMSRVFQTRRRNE